MAESVDLLFRRFQRSGDPRAIAEVYDRVAPELLLVAAHFGQRETDAEDLVQATFLAAIEAVGSYRAERRLMPWLMGILANQARRELRWRSRRPDPTRFRLDSESDLPGPEEHAERSEFAAELERRLRQLPENYRQVLTLRWVHGLGPLEIAHSLGIPPDTVKTRLRRGREILRRALPAGFAAASLFLVKPAPGLAAVREVVLARAAEVALARGLPMAVEAGASQGTVGAAAPGAKLAWGVGLGLLGCCIVVVGLVFSGDRGEGARPVESVEAAADEGIDASARSASGDPAEPERTSTAGAVTGPGPAPLTLQILWTDETPAPAVQVRLRRFGQNDPLFHERWFRSDANGEILVHDLETGRYEARVHRGGSDRFLYRSDQAETREITVPAGLQVEGRVTGKERHPVAGAEIWLSGDEWPDEGRVVGATAADGSFHLQDVAAGRHLSVLVEGHIPHPLERLEGSPEDRVSVRFDLSDQDSIWSIAGTVLDENRQPVAGALVQLGRRLPHLGRANAGMGEHARVPPILLRTDEQGRFRRSGFLTFDRHLEVWARSAGMCSAYLSVPFDRRDKEIELQLPTGVTLDGDTRDRDGAPLPGTRVVVRDGTVGNYSWAPRWTQAEATSDAQGHYTVAGLHPGEIVAEAFGPDGLRAAAVLSAKESAIWDAVLTETAAIEGQLTDADGKPLEQLSVSVVAAGGLLAARSTSTDRYGTFRLEDCVREPHQLWVNDPHSPWNGVLLSRLGVEPGAGPLHLVLPGQRVATAAIEGRVVDEGGRPLAARLALGNLRAGEAYAVTDPDTGRFRLGPLPALRTGYHLYVEQTRKRVALVNDIRLRPGAVSDLGEIRIQEPGALRLRVVGPDGQPVKQAYGRISRPEGFFAARVLVTDGEGWRGALAAGGYAIHFPGEEVAQSATTFEIVAGQETGLTLELEAAAPRLFTFSHPDDGLALRLDLIWCDAAGRPLCRDRVQWQNGPDLAVRQAFGLGSYRLRVRSHAGLGAEVRFHVTDLGAEVAPIPVILE